MSDTVISSVFICPKCKYTNPSKSKFCMQCGAPLSGTAKQTNGATLILVEKGTSEKSFPLSEKTVLGKGNDISIDGADFSKNICEFNFSKKKLALKIFEDGVYLKLSPDSTVELESGAELKIGNKVFRVEI